MKLQGFLQGAAEEKRDTTLAYSASAALKYVSIESWLLLLFSIISCHDSFRRFPFQSSTRKARA